MRPDNKLTKWGGYLVVAALFVTSCQKGNEYEQALPKDAAVVVSADLASMADKSGLGGDEGKDALNRLSDALKSGMKGSEQLIDKIVKDPSESGLDLRKNVYFFVESQSTSAGLVASVRDDGKVEDLLDELRKQQLCEEPRESEGCTWTVMGRVLVAYNGDTFLAIADPKGGAASDMQHTAAMMLRQKENEGFCGTDGFKRMKEAKGDIVAMTSLDMLPMQYSAMLTMGGSADMKLQDVKMMATVNFENGKVVADIENLSTDKTFNELSKQLYQATSPVKGSYLPTFAENTVVWMSANVDGSKLYSLLNGNATISQELENSMMPIDFEAIFNAVKGDVAVVSPNPLTSGFVAYADVTDAGFLQTFEGLKPLLALTGGQMVLRNEGKDAYRFQMLDGRVLGMRPGPASLWFGVKDNRFYLTNDVALLEAPKGTTLESTPWAGQVKGKRFFMGVNFAPAVAVAGTFMRGSSQLAPAMAVLGGFDYLTVETFDEKKGRIELVMKDRNRNVLRSLTAPSN